MPDFDSFGLLMGGTTLLTVLGVCGSLVCTFAFTGVILWFTVRPLMQNMQQQNRILQSGVLATATVLQLAETGMMVNYQPQVRILLQVNPPNGAPYQAEVTRVISHVQIPRVQPGAVVPVKIDPGDPTKVALAL
jgi:hypothetical protein